MSRGCKTDRSEAGISASIHGDFDTWNRPSLRVLRHGGRLKTGLLSYGSRARIDVTAHAALDGLDVRSGESALFYTTVLR